MKKRALRSKAKAIDELCALNEPEQVDGPIEKIETLASVLRHMGQKERRQFCRMVKVKVHDREDNMVIVDPKIKTQKDKPSRRNIDKE